MKLLKSLLAATMGAAIAFSASASAENATNFPTKSVRIVIPYSVGGVTDLIGRALADRLSKTWGQSVIIESKPGASEAIAAAAVATAPADGHTLLLASDATYITNAILRKGLLYNPETDFTPITRLAEGFGFLVIRPDLPVRSLKELLELAQSRAGEVTFGSEAVGSPAEFRMRILGGLSGGYKMNHIPYNGMNPILVDMLGGRIDAAWLPPHMGEPQIKAGKVIGIATNGPERNWLIPAIPTMVEQGYEGADLTFKLMLAAPAGTPEPIVQKIAKDVISIMKDPEFNEKVLRANGYMATLNGPEEFQQYLDTARPALAKVAKEAGFEPK